MKFWKELLINIINGGLLLLLFCICIQCDYILAENLYDIEWQHNVIPFIPEIVYIYVFILLFIYSFFNKMSSLDCFTAYLALINIVIDMYKRILEAENFANNKFWFNDALAINIKITIFILLAIVLLIMYLSENKESEIFLNFETLSLILLCIAGILIFISSNHLFILYLGIELQSLSLYILCSLKRHSNKSLEAGLKYFLYGSFSSSILLLGITFIYGSLGSLSLNEISLLISITNFTQMENIMLHIGLLCILAGFLFKLAIFPFHWWLVDIYEGSADIITFFLAIIPKLPLFYVLYRLYLLLFSKYIIYTYILMFCGVASIAVGTILALYEVKLKKLLAYSSISHMGYIIIAMSLGSKIGMVVSFYYFFIYIITTIYIFSIFLTIKFANNNSFKYITDLVYLKNNNKLLALITITSLLSLGGIPPLIGFYGKLYIFYLLIASGNYYICLFLILLSILSCVYYIRLIRFLFFDDKLNEPMVFIKVQSYYLYIIIVCCFFINIGFLFFQEPLLLHITLLFY